MGNIHRRKGKLAKNKRIRKSHMTKRRTKDLDQIQEDLQPSKKEILQAQFDQDLPGMGQHYCVSCSRYFISLNAIDHHNTSKEHKKRLKATKEPVHTQETAEFCAGMRKQTIPLRNKLNKMEIIH